MSFLPTDKPMWMYCAFLALLLSAAVAAAWICTSMPAGDDDDCSAPAMTPDELREYLETNTADDDCAEPDDVAVENVADDVAVVDDSAEEVTP